MRLVFSAFLLLDSLLSGQTAADAAADKMLARIDSVRRGDAVSKSAACQPWIPFQQAIRAPDQWSEHCVTRTNGLIEESFFYVFDDGGPALLRMEVHPETQPGVDVAGALREKLTLRFGAPAPVKEILEISVLPGVDHWSSGKLHYFVPPIGARLIVFDDRLFKEHEKDDFIEQADVLFHPASPARPFLQQLMGNYYMGLLDAIPKTSFERPLLAQQISREALGLLAVTKRALLDERAMLLLAVNGLVTKLSTLLLDSDAETSMVRNQLASFGVTLGPMLHNGGLAYNQDLLWRVWREYPVSQAGQLAFVELQQRGWYTEPGSGCPANPDLFHDVIEHGEAFLAQHPATPFRKEVLFTLAVAEETWWSVAHAPADDGWVSGIPYPRKDLNRQDAAAAKKRAIDYYQQIVKLAPDSPEATSAERRLPRLKLGLDTGQRRFFCSYD
ncbi:MAG: hypothetical protein ABSF22_08340 [Bryobacteraceae bacterium]